MIALVNNLIRFTACGTVLALSLLTVSASARPATSAPAGQPAPTRLVGLYEAHFTTRDEQTRGTWHLRVGPGHHLKVWNRADPIAYSPSFEAGPVSFRGDRIVFANATAKNICTGAATYSWTLSGDLLRFRPIGGDNCQPRLITFTPHAWRRAAVFVPFVTDFGRQPAAA